MKPKGLSRSAAGRMAIIKELLAPPIFDDNDNIIGYGEPLITQEQARELLEMGYIDMVCENPGHHMVVKMDVE